MVARISLRDYQSAFAERLRSAEAGGPTSKLGVQAGSDCWLVDLAVAGEVIPVPSMTPVPLARAWIRGVTNIRGNLYSVVDFPAFLGGAPAPITDQSRLLLIGERFRTGSALLIDRLLGLRNPAQLRQRPSSGAHQRWVKAEYTDQDGRGWKELDMPLLVRHPDFLDVAS